MDRAGSGGEGGPAVVGWTLDGEGAQVDWEVLTSWFWLGVGPGEKD